VSRAPEAGSGGSGTVLPPTAAVRARMQRTPQRDNPRELELRSALHRLGLRFRVHYRVTPTSRAEADVAFTGQRVAVLIDGCFWHGCPLHATRPRHNAEWWARKLDENIARDRRADTTFREAGWTVLRFWEHEPIDTIVGGICRVVRPAGLKPTSLTQPRPVPPFPTKESPPPCRPG
jgi:DNA mismatch endonuclease (patch repair protein)